MHDSLPVYLLPCHALFLGGSLPGVLFLPGACLSQERVFLPGVYKF